MVDILDLLKPDGYIMVNKKIVQLFGLHEAILLGSLCSKQSYWKDHWDTTTYGQWDGYFFCTAEQFEEETTLSSHFQRKAFTNLEEQGIIKTTLRGVPAKKYFHVNEYKLLALFCPEEETKEVETKVEIPSNPSIEPDQKLDVDEVEGNNIKDTDTKTNNSLLKSENKFSAEIEEILSYLNEVTGKKYRGKSSGHRKVISARLREGFTVSDFKSIIDKKYADWHNTEWERYLTPSTLFCTKHFEDYLNQKPRKNTKPAVVSKGVEWDGTFDSDEVY